MTLLVILAIGLTGIPLISGGFCPDQKTRCPAAQTCCINSAGTGYGCCPYAGAVCCSDGAHCCPGGTVCDVAESRCTMAPGLRRPYPFFVSDWKDFEVQNQLGGEPEVRKKLCPDGKQKCPDSYTCCGSPDGYGCCPMTDAVCCSDQVHCCPKGNRCNIEAGRCDPA